jgi:uncharacterized protein (TIGR02453 family)
MLAAIDEINHAMVGFAPEHLRPAHKVMMRIYRDTRFAKDKRPYKKHVSAWWSRAGMEKTSGGGFYLQVSPQEVLIAIGVYMPEREQLLMIREWMAEHHEEYRAMQKTLFKARSLGFTGVDAQSLTRMPKGFPSDHPADELLRARNWGVHALLPAEEALKPSFVKQVVKRFRAAAPMVDALNGAILQGSRKTTKGPRPLF